MSEYDVFVFFTYDQLDSRKDLIQIARNSIEDFNYNVKLAARVHHGIREAFKRGQNAGGKRYGYRSVFSGRQKNGRPLYKLEIVEEEARTIRLIFYLYARKKWSLSKIVKMLNKKFKEKGVHRPPKGKIWTVRQLCTSRGYSTGMFFNELYKGQRIYDKRKSERNIRTGKKKWKMNPREKWIIEDAPELRIISDSLWQEVHKRMAFVRRRSGNDNRKAKKIFSQNLLTPVSRCKECDSTFAICSRGRTGKAKYGCSLRQNGGIYACSNSTKIDNILLENMVIDAICKEFADASSQRTILEEIHVRLSQLVAEELNAKLTEKIASLESDIRNMIDAIKKGKGIESETLLIELKSAETLKKELLGKIVKISPGDNIVAELFFADDLTSFFEDAVKDVKGPLKQKEAITRVIDRIYIRPTNDGAEVEIIENVESIGTYVLSMASARSEVIRGSSRTGWAPYHPRTFKFVVPKKDIRGKRGR